MDFINHAGYVMYQFTKLVIVVTLIYYGALIIIELQRDKKLKKNNMDIKGDQKASPVPGKIDKPEEAKIEAVEKTVDKVDGVDFPGAIKALLEGKLIYRLGWEDDFFGLIKEDVMTLRKPGGGEDNWVLSTEDLEATDWLIKE